MNTFVKTLDNIKDVVAFREVSARYIHEKSFDQRTIDYYRGRADGFRESLLVIQQECNGANARPQAQASIQLAPRRGIVRIESLVFDLRDPAILLEVAEKLTSTFATCDVTEECYCTKCDAKAIEIMAEKVSYKTQK